MIMKMIQMTLFVADQQEAKQFYVNQLGFTIINEQQFSSDWSYVTVSPYKDNQTVIELLKAETEEQITLIGKQAGDQVLLMFETDDIEADYAKLKAKGITFHSEPQKVPGGWGVGFSDLYGNKLDLFQPEKEG
ncbi:VOC family protein [Alkalihalobacillus pseudalcaliphilus]|uniref:VOC family protein n=1 Tax=Alkalihalobacillus pseudalcaliphilus TaxID=79884 RepID=UPI00064D73AC|nr:VOC family protein [Alkalihalobacillus pseudalcaliphilus]KMK78056.1 glyoxalase [Alkalihalobacillus pseudalcaliphilus]